MSSRVNSNYQSFLAHTSPLVPVHYHTQPSGASSFSTVASGAEAKEVRRPHIVLADIWSAYEEFSCYGNEVPLSLEGIDEDVTSYYAPTLSAMQIFTIKPFADDDGGSSSRSSSIGTNDSSSYLYFQYNELELPHERHPLTAKIEQLAEQHSGLHSLTSSDLSPDSWLSIAWYPIYQIPSVKSMKKELSAAFLTYHKLKPDFPETFVEDDKKVKEKGKSSEEEVVFPPFGAMTYKAVGNVWNMPWTSDHDDRDRHEKAASSWVEKLGFAHSDYCFFFRCKFYCYPR